MPGTRSPIASSTVSIAGQPIRAMLVQFPVVCFTLALGTDIAYWQTSNLMWAEFSAWLLLAGIASGVLAAVLETIDLIANRDIRDRGSAWLQATGTFIVLVLAFFNNLVHARDGWTAVMPWGLTLSALTVLAIFVTAWLEAALAHTDHTGVRDHG